MTNLLKSRTKIRTKWLFLRILNILYDFIVNICSWYGIVIVIIVCSWKHITASP